MQKAEHDSDGSNGTIKIAAKRKQKQKEQEHKKNEKNEKKQEDDRE